MLRVSRMSVQEGGKAPTENLELLNRQACDSQLGIFQYQF